MADDDKILFGAEFEGQSLAQGVSDLVNQLKKARQEQENLKEEIAFTNDQIKIQEKEVDDLTKKHAAIQPVTKAAAKQQADLAKEIDRAKTSTQQLKDDLPKLQKQYKDTGVAVKDYTKAVQAQEKAVKQAEKANSNIGKAFKELTNVNKIAGNAVKSLGKDLLSFVGGAATGFIGGLVAGMIPAVLEYVSSLFDAGEEVKKFERQQKLLNEINDEAAKSSGDQVARLEVFRQKLTDLNLPQAERLRVAKEYNKIADEGNKIDLKQIDNLDIINAQIAKQTQLIIKRAIAKAAENKLSDEAVKLVDAQLEVAKNQKTLGAADQEEALSILNFLGQERTRLGKEAEEGGFQERDRLTAFDERIKRTLGTDPATLALFRDNIKNAEKVGKEFAELASFLNPLLLINDTKDPKVRTQRQRKDPDNVYIRELTRIREQIAQLASKEFQSEGLIRDAIEAQLTRDIAQIDKFLADKKLTPTQAAVLRSYAKQYTDALLESQLKDFYQKQADVLKKIDDSIQQARTDLAQKRVANIRDEFEREAAEIELQYQQVSEAYARAQAEFNKGVDAEVKKGLLDPARAALKKNINALVWGDLLDQAAVLRNNRQAVLAAKQFQEILAEAGRVTDVLGLETNQATTQTIRSLTAAYLEGEISYKKYQERLTQILKKEEGDRRAIELDGLRNQKDLIDKRIAASTDPAEIKQLTGIRNNLLAEIDRLERQILTGTVTDDKKNKPAFEDYLKALSEVASQVVSFWNQVNEAEARSLDRSIALQNKRVENAREIAEKGNAEYLEMEQKRLDELERKREANARKQLAINNALTASQALVAAISAIAQATQSGSPLAAIAAVAAVVGAIGAAYSFVNSLQPQEAGFYKGTEYVDDPSAPSGKDTVKARLTKGERVVTKDDNQKYWETLTAIHNHQIPPDVINNFVQSYPDHQIPMVDFNRLAMATSRNMGADSPELLNRVDRLQGTMEEVVDVLGGLGINVRLDEEGLSAQFSRIQKRNKIKSRS